MIQVKKDEANLADCCMLLKLVWWLVMGTWGFIMLFCLCIFEKLNNEKYNNNNEEEDEKEKRKRKKKRMRKKECLY